MEQILDMPSTGQRTLQYAGFWIRFAAVLIDGILLSIVNWVIMMVFGLSAMSMSDPADFNMGAFLGTYAILVIGGILYFVLMESSATQGTLGKMAVGIKVGKENGERISALNALGRYFSRILSALILYVGYMMAGWDPKKQALHDKIAGTYVFYSK